MGQKHTALPRKYSEKLDNFWPEQSNHAYQETAASRDLPRRQSRPLKQRNKNKRRRTGYKNHKESTLEETGTDLHVHRCSQLAIPSTFFGSSQLFDSNSSYQKVEYHAFPITCQSQEINERLQRNPVFVHSEDGSLFSIQPKEDNKFLECLEIPQIQIKEILRRIKVFLKEHDDNAQVALSNILNIEVKDIWAYFLSTVTMAQQTRCGRPDEIADTSESELFCHSCNGQGEIRCAACRSGMVPCYDCEATGFKTTNPHTGNGYEAKSETCPRCKGSGDVKCHYCDGCFSRACTTCKGREDHTFQPPVENRKEKHNCYFTNSSIPKEQLKKCEGICIFKNINDFGIVNPVCRKDCLNKNILMVSETLLAKQALDSKGDEVVEQSHSVSLIPAYEVVMEVIENNLPNRCNTKVFWIIGTDRQVFSPDYSTTNKAHSEATKTISSTLLSSEFELSQNSTS